MKFAFNFFVLVGLCFFGAISCKARISPPDENNGAIEEHKKNPFNISVTQAFYVSNKLKVKVLLESDSDFNSNKIALKITALKQGEVIEEQVKFLSDITEEERIKSGQRFIVPFEIEAQDFSEYQIQCSWGEDVNNISKSSVKHRQENNENSNALSNLSLEKVELLEKQKSCKKVPCPLNFSITTFLTNHSNKVINNIKLAVGIAWSENQETPKIPKDLDPKQDSEEILDLGSFNLAVNAEKRVNVDIDRDLPNLSNKRFYPYIRIVEFNTN